MDIRLPGTELCNKPDVAIEVLLVFSSAMWFKCNAKVTRQITQKVTVICFIPGIISCVLMRQRGMEERDYVIRLRGLPWTASADDVIEFLDGNVSLLICLSFLIGQCSFLLDHLSLLL